MSQFKWDQLIQFVEQQAAAARLNLPMNESIRASSCETLDREWSKTQENLSELVGLGSTLSDAMEHHPAYFPTMLRRMVRVGEEGGALPAMLRQIGDYLQTARDIQHRLRKTLVYPFVVWLILLCQALVLLLFVFPKLGDMTSSLGGQSATYVELLTKLGPAALILGGGLLLYSAWLAVSAVGGAVEGGDATPGWLERLALNMPFFGALNRHAKTAEVCDTLSVLIENGRSPREAVMIARQAAVGANLQRALEEVEAALTSGQEYRGSGKPTLIPYSTLWMLCRSNGDPAITDNLRSLARYHRRQMDSTASLLREALDPVLLIAVAVVAGVMLAALYFTMFDVSTSPLRHIMY